MGATPTPKVNAPWASGELKRNKLVAIQHDLNGGAMFVVR